MANQISFGAIPPSGPVLAPTPESSFRIGVLADFTGRHNRRVLGPSADIAGRPLHRVTRDTLDEVMSKLEVVLHLPVAGVLLAIPFASLEDFSPDSLHDRIPAITDAFDAEEKTTLVNSVVHHPDFQALEAVWRGLDWFLGRVAKGGKVEVLLLDISQLELMTDLKSNENLAGTALYHVLIQRTLRASTGQPWGALVGDYLFQPAAQHAEALARLAKIVSHAKAPFLTAMHPTVLDPAFAFSPEAAPVWQGLRQMPEAAHLGIALPRFLVRLPYGENTKAIDRFTYEEMEIPPTPAHYLWGNPALACAALLAQAYHRAGWGMQPGSVLELDQMPIHVYQKDGEDEVTVAEAWLAQAQIAPFINRGFMPFQCVRGKGALQLSRFLSIAQTAPNQPPHDLVGHWSQGNFAAMPVVSAAPAGPKVGMMAQVPGAPRPPAPTAPAPLPPPAPAAKAPPPSAAPAAPQPAPVAAAAPPAEEEMDPDLAALLSQLE